MRVEVLFFKGCPNHAGAVQRLKELLKEEGLEARIAEIAVPDAKTAKVVGFLGLQQSGSMGSTLNPRPEPRASSE